MTWTYSDESYKDYTRDTWNESADAYDAIARNLDKYSDRLLHFAAPARTDRADGSLVMPSEAVVVHATKR